jgi:hypothetical protein
MLLLKKEHNKMRTVGHKCKSVLPSPHIYNHFYSLKIYNQKSFTVFAFRDVWLEFQT